MSTKFIPPEILILIVEKADREDLKSLMGVSRVFKEAARRKLWSHLIFKSRWKEAPLTLLDLVKTNGLDRMVLSMEVKFRAKTSEPDPEGRRIRFSTIEYDKHFEGLVPLLRLLPNLQILNIASPTFDSISPIHHQNLSIFPSLTTIIHTPKEGDYRLQLLRQLLHIAPSVHSIRLAFVRNHFDKMHYTNTIPGEQIDPITTCPNLRSINISNAKFHIFNSSAPLFPFASLAHLSHLTIRVKPEGTNIEMEGILLILERSAATLRTVKITTHQSIPFQLIETILPQLKLVTSLFISRVVKSPTDILHLIPLSVTKLGINLDLSHLQHLEDNPRADLKLEELTLATCESYDIVEALPYSLNVLRLTNATVKSLDKLLLILEDLEDASGIERVELDHGDSRVKLINYQEDRIHILDRFRTIGVRIHFNYKARQ